MGKTLDRRIADTADLHPAWKLHDAFETYGVKNWGKGYFGINKLGHVTVHPDKDPERGIDLKDLVDQLQRWRNERLTSILSRLSAEELQAVEKAFGYLVAACSEKEAVA